jgi:hypothetical protein
MLPPAAAAMVALTVAAAARQQMSRADLAIIVIYSILSCWVRISS